MMRRDYPRQIRIRIQGEDLEIQLSVDQPVAVVVTDTYEAWIGNVTDRPTNARITRDVGKMRRGLFGDWKEVDSIFEMRLDYGPGYRVYYGRYRDVVVILLGGGDKSSQQSDLKRARRLWEELEHAIEEI